MTDLQTRYPILVFKNIQITFPERGSHAFLPLEEPNRVQVGIEPCSEQGIWLFRVESGMCGIIPSRVRLLRNGLVVHGMALLHHGQEIEYADHKAKFYNIRRRELVEGSRFLQHTCLYCRCLLEIGDTVFQCPLCDETYHEDCWTALRGSRCYSRNCRFSPSSVE